MERNLQWRDILERWPKVRRRKRTFECFWFWKGFGDFLPLKISKVLLGFRSQKRTVILFGISRQDLFDRSQKRTSHYLETLVRTYLIRIKILSPSMRKAKKIYSPMILSAQNVSCNIIFLFSVNSYGLIARVVSSEELKASIERLKYSFYVYHYFQINN